MTSGTLSVTGTSVSVKWPAASVSALATGLPATEPQRSHDAPVVIGSGVVLGTYTITL
jgi:hypothetical protein